MAVVSLATAWTAAISLGILTGGIMYISAKKELNPDNISGPLVVRPRPGTACRSPGALS
mgnify:CR=1 FL=1